MHFFHRSQYSNTVITTYSCSFTEVILPIKLPAVRIDLVSLYNMGNSKIDSRMQCRLCCWRIWQIFVNLNHCIAQYSLSCATFAIPFLESGTTELGMRNPSRISSRLLSPGWMLRGFLAKTNRSKFTRTTGSTCLELFSVINDSRRGEVSFVLLPINAHLHNFESRPGPRNHYQPRFEWCYLTLETDIRRIFLFACQSVSWIFFVKSFLSYEPYFIREARFALPKYR